MKILCFTTSYNRPYYIYHTINSILSQSYQNFDYSVNIALNNLEQRSEYEWMLKDFNSDQRLKVVYNKNTHQQTNYMNAMMGFNNTDYDLFIKIDDDDIYHKTYIEKVINHFEEQACDILSFTCKHHINNNKIKNEIKSIGNWKQDNHNIKFGMPPTFVFNKKAFDIIKNITIQQSKNVHPFEDGAWKQYWRKNLLKSVVIENEDVFTYNIHQNNTSSTFLLDHNPTIIDTEFASIIKFNHPHWSSYVYINKRNNKIYNIQNDDHGSFDIDKNKIIIKWEEWDHKEVYQKEYLEQRIYCYNFIENL